MALIFCFVLFERRNLLQLLRSKQSLLDAYLDPLDSSLHNYQVPRLLHKILSILITCLLIKRLVVCIYLV